MNEFLISSAFVDAKKIKVFLPTNSVYEIDHVIFLNTEYRENHPEYNFRDSHV